MANAAAPPSTEEQHGHERRIALIAAFAALLGALAGGLAGFLGTTYNAQAENERLLREQRAQVYSGLLSSVTRLEAAIPGAKARAEGVPNREAEWALMMERFGALVDAAALVQLTGSQEVQVASEELDEQAREVRAALEALYLAPGREAPPLAAALDALVADFDSLKSGYAEAAEADLVPEQERWWRIF